MTKTLPIVGSTDFDHEKLPFPNSPIFSLFKDPKSIYKTKTSTQVKYQIGDPSKNLRLNLVIPKNLPAQLEINHGDNTLCNDLSMDTLHSPTEDEPLSLDQVKQAIAQLPNSLWKDDYDFQMIGDRIYLYWWVETKSLDTWAPQNVEYRVELHVKNSQ